MMLKGLLTGPGPDIKTLEIKFHCEPFSNVKLYA